MTQASKGAGAFNVLSSPMLLLNSVLSWSIPRNFDYRRFLNGRQQLKLMDTVAAIVGTLDERELFQSIISHTGRKHADFGVQRSHFTAFGEALIWGLQQQFGRAFTPEMEQAWIVLYDTIQTEMMRAAKIQSEDRLTHTV
jgi:hemoglobin-like flavoprotein